MKIPVRVRVVAAWFATNAVAQDTEWAGKIRLARQAQASGRYLDAIALLRQAVALTDAFGPKDARTWETYGSLAMVYEDAGLPADSMRVNRQTIGMVKATIGKDNATYARLLANLATVYMGLGDMAPAGSLLKEALRIETELPRPDPGDVATLESRLAVVLASRHHYAETERLIGLALPVLEGTGDTVEAATALSTLGMVRSWQRRYDESLELLGQAVGMVEKKYGPRNPLLLRSLSTLAAGLYAGGQEGRGRGRLPAGDSHLRRELASGPSLARRSARQLCTVPTRRRRKSASQSGGGQGPLPGPRHCQPRRRGNDGGCLGLPAEVAARGKCFRPAKRSEREKYKKQQADS